MIACQIGGRHRFRKVTPGPDPAEIRYLVISQPTRITTARGLVSPPPGRDLVTVDGHPLVLCDTTITLVLTPRPMPGTICLIVPCPDAGLARLKQP